MSFPGAAVWHVPWTDKNDGVDWQSYFHHRNRIIAALLHSPYERGGRMVRESLNHQVKHLASLQYSTAELRHLAMEDVLRGPHALHGELATKLAEINAFRKQFTDAQLHADRDDLPPVRRKKPPKKGKSDIEIPGRKATLIAAGLAPLRQLRPVREMSEDYPETELTAMDAAWFNLVKYDSVVVSMNDGTSVALYQRDPAHYRDLLKRTVAIHRRFHASGRAWPSSTATPSARSPRPRRGRRPSRPGPTRRTAPRRPPPTLRRARPSEPPVSTTASGPARRTSAELEALPLAPPAATGLSEVVRRRYLLGMLVRNTIKSRYQGTVLGWLWSYLQPAIRFCMFYFLFQVMIGRGAGMENFAIHLFAGMVIVHFFTETFNGGTQSLVQNRSLITKLPVPREMFPVARMLVAGWHTIPMLVILVMPCLFLGWTPDPVGMAAALLGFTLTASLGLALGLLFSVGNVFMRDIGKVAQTLTQFVTFSVPMMYPYTLV